MLEHAADFAVLALGQAHLDPAVAAGAPLEVGVDRAVAHALDGDALGKILELRLGDRAERAGAVVADDAGARQLELALQLAVVGQQQQPLGHEVEAADRHQPRQALRQPVVDRRPALGVARGGQRRRRLVEAEQARRRGGRTGLPSTVTPARSVSRVAGVVSDLAVERDAPVGDHPLDIAPRGDPGAGEQLGDALRSGLARLGPLGTARGRAPRRRGTGSVIRSLRGQGHGP